MPAGLSKTSHNPYRLYAWTMLAAALAAAANTLFGMSEFAGFDVSPLIDSGWRIASGQRPNVDFVCTFPPSLYLPTALAYKVFGVHWLSMLLAEEMLYLVLCVLGLRLCWILFAEQTDRRTLSLVWIYVAAQTILLLTVNHLWHSTTAAGFAAYAILACCTLLRLSSPCYRWELATHLAFAFAVLLLSKPNTAWTALLVCMVCLLLARRSALIACVAFALAALTDTLVLAAFHIRIVDVVKVYAGLGSRAAPRLFLVGISPSRSRTGAIVVALTYLLLAGPLYRLLQAAWENRFDLRRRPEDLLCLAAGLVSLVGLGTNWDVKIVDVPAFFIGAAVLATMQPGRYGRVLPSLQWSVALLCLISAIVGAGRLRMKADGPWAGAQYGQTVRLHDPFFGKMKTHAAFAEVLREADMVVNQSHGKQVFFGPRLEFLYAREGLISPAHLPLWWHPGTSYPLTQEAYVEKNWEDDDFDVLIFAKHDRTVFPGALFPEKLAMQAQAHYRLNASLPEIDVYTRSP